MALANGGMSAVLSMILLAMHQLVEPRDSSDPAPPSSVTRPLPLELVTWLFAMTT